MEFQNCRIYCYHEFQCAVQCSAVAFKWAQRIELQLKLFGIKQATNDRSYQTNKLKIVDLQLFLFSVFKQAKLVLSGDTSLLQEKSLTSLSSMPLHLITNTKLSFQALQIKQEKSETESILNTRKSVSRKLKVKRLKKES